MSPTTARRAKRAYTHRHQHNNAVATAYMLLYWLREFTRTGSNHLVTLQEQFSLLFARIIYIN
jgi:hypothetical protein